MWLLQSDGDVFGGRTLWLRPGKTYLFGRTSMEPGMLVVADKTVSRKHITIRVERVKDGDGQNRNSRSTITIEDLKTKIGTFVNGAQIKGTALLLTETTNTVKLGHFSKLFHLTWQPVVLSFSFTSRELQSDPWARLREELEQLDIKYIPDYDVRLTSHVVTKKRNTSKGLQALINGAYIVTDGFLRAISEAAQTQIDPQAGETSLLEQDFDINWPNPLEYLPPRGDEPCDRPAAAYAPDANRKEIFDGYTFIFFEKTQFNNLLAPITNGKGKALLHEVFPHKTQIDDFIRYVKDVAGEKGLGEFEDGSEGKGVVVVRYAPASKYDTFEWYAEFVTSVSLRLDHRMIDQREFLDAILAGEPGMLRRPLEIEPESVPADAADARQSRAAPDVLDVDEPGSMREQTLQVEAPAPKARKPRRRFRGFDADDDEEEQTPTPVPLSQDMFVSQVGAVDPETGAGSAGRSSRKRAYTPVPDDPVDILESIAPAAAAVKRRRIAAGEDLQNPPPPPSADDDDVVLESPPTSAAPAVAAKSKKKGAIDTQVLDLARKRMEETEAKAREEADRLAQLPEDGIDAAEIRRLTIVEEMEVRQPGAAARTREQDIADGRWDPRWNGRQNFKKFRKAHQPAGLPRQRVLVGYEVAKNKVYGIGDDYWLDEEQTTQTSQRKKTRQSQNDSSLAARPSEETSSVPSGRTKAPSRLVVESESDEDDDLVGLGSRSPELDPDPIPVGDAEPNDGEDHGAPLLELDLPRTKRGKAAQKENVRQSQRHTQSTTQSRTTRSQQPPQTRAQATLSGRATGSSSAAPASTTTASAMSTRAAGKRAAAAPPAKERPTKKTRGREIADSDSDDEDGGKFRFGKR